MRMTYVLSAAAAAILLTVPIADAQQTTPAPGKTQVIQGLEMMVIPDGAVIIQPFNVKADDLEDGDLYGSDGKKIGEIEEVLVDASGKPVAITVEVGGFLGMGDKEIVLRLDQVQLKDEHDLSTSMTRQQIEELPAWKK